LQPREARPVDIASRLKQLQLQQDCGTGVIPLTVGQNGVIPLTVGPVCRSPKRRQMEFTNKKNQSLKTDVKQIIETARAIADYELQLPVTRDMARRIEKLALDVLVEL
jgi:hypothetical protein